jgi:hypothetical protein
MWRHGAERGSADLTRQPNRPLLAIMWPVAKATMPAMVAMCSRLIGLLNPITGVLLGTAIAGETLAVQQICGLVLGIASIAVPTIPARCCGSAAASPRTATRAGSPRSRTGITCTVGGSVRGRSG